MQEKCVKKKVEYYTGSIGDTFVVKYKGEPLPSIS